MIFSRKLAAGCLLALAWALASMPANADDVAIGRAIYEEGRLPSGAPLTGRRFGNERIAGAKAACITCHRRSGMGAVEGEVIVSPITGKALFSETERVVATMDPRRGKAFNRPHPPYTATTLARALREGIHATDRQMNPLMPRYVLSDAEIRGLMAYLQQLSVNWSPGATAEQVRFATVITPDVDPRKKAVFRAMVETAERTKNASTNPGRRYMTSAAELMLRSGRRWHFDIWELSGPPDTWGEQLARFYQENPVFAIVSGLSQSTWEPVDAFCQQEKLPCLFPSVDLPPAAEGNYRPVYFSRGVLLEADVLATYLRSLSGGAPRRLVQVHAGSVAGVAAAQRLTTALQGSPIQVETRQVAIADGAQLRGALADLGDGAAAMLWLNADEVARLDGLTPPARAEVFLSGRLIDGDPLLVPSAWRGESKLLYPYELPDKRRGNLAYLNAWLKLRKIEALSEPFQSEVFFALNFVSDTLSEMLNNLYRDYFLERTENMVAFREGSKAEQEVRDRNALGRSTLRGTNQAGASMAEARELLALGQSEQGRAEQGGTTVYPRLSLGAGQRFASKGAYVVRFAAAGSDAIVPVSDWLVP